jgi:predicted nuclease of predicted toxin-antitoxin system
VRPRFLVDAQLPPGLAKHLSALGYDADHVNRLGLGAAGNRAIWAYAVANAAALVTKDEDFVALARHGPTGAAVIWARIGNCTNEALWRVLESALPEILVALAAGEWVIEVI